MSCLIDRQAVIDLLKQMRKDGDMVPLEGKVVFARIRKLPTIQPEKAQLSQEGTTSDLVSRQAAIDALDCISGVEEVLRSLPTIQPERAKGEWSDGYRWQRCSLCKQTGRKSWNYCPNCGAKMDGDGDAR